MSQRLSSFLSSIERACQAEASAPKGGGRWENSRTINYHLGLARLAIGTQGSTRNQPLGAILVQAFDLADGSTCLKASLSWAGREADGECVRSVFEKPSVDWTAAAAQIAQAWLAGPPAALPRAQRETAEPVAALAAVG